MTYTHQKLKKHKSYKDGFLTYDVPNRRLTLYDAEHRIVDSMPVAQGHSVRSAQGLIGL